MLKFSEEAVDELLRREWPGNVRELRNAVEHAAITARSGLIEPHHLPPAGRYEPTAGDAAARLKSAVTEWADGALVQPDPRIALHERLLSVVEPPLFESVLRTTDGNRAAAAEILGIHRATLRKKLAEPRSGETAGDDE